MYSHLYEGHVQRPNMGIIKKRYRDLLMQLKSYNALDAKKFEEMYKALDGVRHDSSLDNMLSDISNAVMKARENNSLNGAVRHITVEDPTKVRGGKSGRLGQLTDQNVFNERFEALASTAINSVAPYQTFWNGKGDIQIQGREAQNLLASHDEAVKSILSRNGIGKDVAVSTANLKSSRSSLTKLAEAFVSQGMHVQLRFDGQRNGLKMVLADKNVSESVLNGSLPDLMKNNNVGVIDLPKINKDGSLTLGSQNRVARLKAQKVKNGYQFVTGFDEILGTLASSAKTVRNMLDSASELGQRNGMLQANNYLASRSRRAMMNLSMNNRYGNPADAENMFQVRSKASNWIRGGAVDISDFAQEWYTNFYNNASPERRKLWKLKAPEKVLEQARQTGDIFANVMGVQARRAFQRQSDAFVNDKTGMNLGMHSIKDTHVSNYLRANRDARQLLPFGYFNPMARENIMKSVNYLALDENSVREKLASQGFSSQEIDRMVKRGVVTNQSLNVLEGNGDGKIAYLNMRAAYMDDSQLKSRAKELASTYEARALNGSLPQEDRDKYKGFAERLRNAESISTYDGMFLMSQEAASAFETTREKRISLADGADLTDEIKAIIQRYAKGEVDFSKNITEEDFKSLPKLVQHLDPNVDTKQEWNTKKKVTVSQITTQDILRDAEDNLVFDKDGNPVMQSKTRADQVYDRWYASNTRIKGWNAEERALILEEQVTSTNTTKFITDAGGRQTATMLPGEVIRDLAGGEAHAIMPAFEAGKGMWGTELNKFISLAVDEAKAQVDKHGATTVGSLSKQEALEEINNIMQRSFNIKNKSLSRVVDGQIVVDELLGTGDDKSIDYTFKNVSRFMREVDEKLGLNISDKNYAFGNVGVGRQDIYDWENGIGLVDDHEKGLVKYGRKEVDMIAARAEQVLNTKDSALMGWLNNHMQYAARAQNEGIERIARGLIRTVSQESDYVPNKGDVVIRTTGAAFPGDDPLGRETGRVTENGVREISMHAINDTPTITSKDTKLVADAYSGSIVDFGRAKGSFFDGVSFGSAIQQNGGTALLEMPDETFAKKYIRLVDFGDIAKGGPDDVPIIRDIQKTQQRIWRDIKEYQAVGSNGDLDLEKREERLGNIRDRINNSVQEYEDKAARMITNSRDSGLMKTMGAASMDMAGRFRIQGVNPFANYEQVDGKWQQSPTAKYEEGTVYMSRDRLKEMITDRQGRATHATRNMANAMGIDIKGLKGNEITELVLDNVNDKGLYGFVNRYPTIKQSTIQAMKVQIDDEMTKEGNRGARLTVGTATRLKADYDGDFLSTVLTHYSTSKEDATAIHGELSRLNEEERLAARSTGAEVLEDLHKEFTQTAKHLNVTVGELAKEVQEAAQIAPENRNKRQQGFMDIYNNAMKHTMSASDALETREARLGKEFVGFIDNTRDKVLNLATETVRVLQSSGRISADDAKAYRNSIEDFTAAFSQDLISSKKFNVQNEIQRQMQLDSNIGETEAERRAREAIDNRYLKIQDMNEAIMNPTSENIELFKRHNEEIGLFDTSDPQEAKKMNRALDMIQDVAKFNGTSGGFNNTSLTMAVSEGKGADTVRQFLNGQGDAVVGTKAVRNIAEWADDETGQRLKQGINRWEKSVVQNFDSIESGDSLIDSISKSSFDSSDHVLNGATVAEEARVKLRDVVGKFTPKISGGIGGGVVAFGAMWAASALIRKAPTPEGLQEQTKEPAPAPAPKESMQTPTARITQNDGEYVNIRVSAKNAKNMSEEDIAALVHQEIGSMTSMKMDTTLNVNDNTQNIDQQWLQGVVANAIDKGFGF
ncbi:hypothetical protein QO179_24680 [Bacillus stercoris]|nr:hypothetical protein [Bacillus stercoris]